MSATSSSAVVRNWRGRAQQLFLRVPVLPVKKGKV